MSLGDMELFLVHHMSDHVLEHLLGAYSAGGWEETVMHPVRETGQVILTTASKGKRLSYRANTWVLHGQNKERERQMPFVRCLQTAHWAL